MGYIKEVGSDEYAPTNFSLAMNIPIIADGYPVLYVQYIFLLAVGWNLILTLLVLVDATPRLTSFRSTSKRPVMSRLQTLKVGRTSMHSTRR